MTNSNERFAEVRDEILEHWNEMWPDQFKEILEEVEDKTFQWKFPVNFEEKQEVMLRYQEPPRDGKRTGRYIGHHEVKSVDLVDETIQRKTVMNNGRQLSPAATLDSHGFCLTPCPTSVESFVNTDEVKEKYYEEMKELVMKQSGASRVVVFDHTIRESGRTNLNAATADESAAPVPRVHCDYTADGAPRRLEQFEGGKEFVESGKRFAFINVWRSIDREHPVMQMPLAVCDENTVPEEDRFLYELHFEDRIGENYSLQFNENHDWYCYPKMTLDECLLFKVYDREQNGVRFVFHTAFEDPRGGFRAPPRKSVEVRTIAFFD